jgi:hypothetical protein
MDSNKKKPLYSILLFVSVITIGITGILNGVKHGETWLIIVSCISLAMITLAAVINLISFYREKKHLGDI